MEIIKSYPLIFAFTVILPALGGFVGAYIGWDSLKSRQQDELHQKKVVESLQNVESKIEPITTQIDTIQRYEKALSKYNQKDEVLSAVLAQYLNMKSSLEIFNKFRGTDDIEERGELAENILQTLTSNITPIIEAPELPNDPLIISLGTNIYKVLFAVPMRIKPKLTFTGLPEGSTYELHEHTRFGFTVKFKPHNILIKNFGFTADAEL